MRRVATRRRGDSTGAGGGFKGGGFHSLIHDSGCFTLVKREMNHPRQRFFHARVAFHLTNFVSHDTFFHSIYTHRDNEKPRTWPDSAVGVLLPIFYSIEDLSHLPEPRWLIEGLFEQDALVMLVGPPGSFKSFLAIDWALSLAAGRAWNKRAIKPSRVLYALGEGKASLLKRIHAWIHHNHLTPAEKERLYTNFKVTFDVPQLAVPRDATRFTNALDEDQFSPEFLVIDTLARSYVGKNENDAMDVGVWIDNVDKLRKRGMTVLVLHHTKKNTEGGLKYRGNTAWLGAMDTAFLLERNPEGYKGLTRLSCDKQKDHQEPEDVWMRSLAIRPNPNIEGSIVLIETERPGLEDEIQRIEEQNAFNELIKELLEDATFTSDRARARVLAEKTNILEATAQTRIHRARKTLGLLNAE